MDVHPPQNGAIGFATHGHVRPTLELTFSADPHRRKPHIAAHLSFGVMQDCSVNSSEMGPGGVFEAVFGRLVTAFSCSNSKKGIPGSPLNEN